jgi:hypothetical protein
MFKNLFQKPSKEPPFSDVELILKQINPADLSDLGREALNQAFTGFYDEVQETQVAQEAHEFFNSSEFGEFKLSHASEKVQPGESKSYRRYAGDSGLPRGRYYSVCSDEGGNDNGTLLQEIRAYHNPLKAEQVLVLDSTLPEWHEEAFKMGGNHSPHLIIKFVPIWGEKPKFARLQLSKMNKEGDVLQVYLPMRVTREVRKNVLDLRQPEAAEWFTREFTRLPSNPDSPVKIVDTRPPLNSFFELLPTLLEQGLGGSDQLNAAGTWLRALGAEGLIFPSARTDASVTFQRKKIASFTGFNFVDYSNAPRPRLMENVESEDSKMHIFLTAFPHWPQYPQYTPPLHKFLNEQLPEEERNPIIFDSVKIYYVPEGTNQGSWQVEGLRNVPDAKYRFNQAMAVLLFLLEKKKLSEESTASIFGWLHHLWYQAKVEVLGSWAYSIIMITLYNDESSREGITTVIQNMESDQLNPALVQAMREFLEIKHPKQISKDAQEQNIPS